VNEARLWIFQQRTDLAQARMTVREITLAVLEGKTPAASRKQEVNPQAAILVALRGNL
jgi:hypothetical protein